MITCLVLASTLATNARCSMSLSLPLQTCYVATSLQQTGNKFQENQTVTSGVHWVKLTRQGLKETFQGFFNRQVLSGQETGSAKEVSLGTERSKLEGGVSENLAYAKATLETLLGSEAKSLEAQAASKVLTLLQCVKQQGIPYQPILTVIDYHLPSNQKRLWVFDLKDKKLLYHTYVSHGIKSGSLFTSYFSNRYNSKASSIGVYKTEKIYYGRQGLSLKLDGLDRGFNDNAQNRAIVMHGGWYVNEDFIKKYGRPGRSWGCPALPLEFAKPIIDTIKDNTLFVVYYPDENWLEKSKFLNCEQMASALQADPKLPPSSNRSSNPSQASSQASSLAMQSTAVQPSPNDKKNAAALPPDDRRDAVLFADLTGKHQYVESQPLVVMSASNYARIYEVPVPLNRMVRKKINQEEYVALNPEEFQKLVIKYEDQHQKDLSKGSNQTDISQDQSRLENTLYFVTPSVKMQRGYYVTEMKLVAIGKIRSLQHNGRSLGEGRGGERVLERKTTSNVLAEGQPTGLTTPPLSNPQDDFKNAMAESYSILFDDHRSLQIGVTKQFIRWLGL